MSIISGAVFFLLLFFNLAAAHPAPLPQDAGSSVAQQPGGPANAGHMGNGGANIKAGEPIVQPITLSSGAQASILPMSTTDARNPVQPVSIVNTIVSLSSSTATATGPVIVQVESSKNPTFQLSEKTSPAAVEQSTAVTSSSSPTTASPAANPPSISVSRSTGASVIPSTASSATSPLSPTQAPSATSLFTSRTGTHTPSTLAGSIQTASTPSILTKVPSSPQTSTSVPSTGSYKAPAPSSPTGGAEQVSAPTYSPSPSPAQPQTSSPFSPQLSNPNLSTTTTSAPAAAGPLTLNMNNGQINGSPVAKPPSTSASVAASSPVIISTTDKGSLFSSPAVVSNPPSNSAPSLAPVSASSPKSSTAPLPSSAINPTTAAASQATLSAGSGGAFGSNPFGSNPFGSNPFGTAVQGAPSPVPNTLLPSLNIWLGARGEAYHLQAANTAAATTPLLPVAGSPQATESVVAETPTIVLQNNLQEVCSYHKDSDMPGCLEKKKRDDLEELEAWAQDYRAHGVKTSVASAAAVSTANAFVGGALSNTATASAAPTTAITTAMHFAVPAIENTQTAAPVQSKNFLQNDVQDVCAYYKDLALPGCTKKRDAEAEAEGGYR